LKAIRNDTRLAENEDGDEQEGGSALNMEKGDAERQQDQNVTRRTTGG
jgi:hypothetical protein